MDAVDIVLLFMTIIVFMLIIAIDKSIRDDDKNEWESDKDSFFIGERRD